MLCTAKIVAGNQWWGCCDYKHVVFSIPLKAQCFWVGLLTDHDTEKVEG